MNLNIPFVNGAYVRQFSSPLLKSHDLALDLTGITGGTLVIEARKPGSSFFEAIPDGTINLASPSSVTFYGSVREYRFTLSGATGTASELVITDTVTV